MCLPFIYLFYFFIERTSSTHCWWKKYLLSNGVTQTLYIYTVNIHHNYFVQRYSRISLISSLDIMVLCDPDSLKWIKSKIKLADCKLSLLTTCTLLSLSSLFTLFASLITNSLFLPHFSAINARNALALLLHICTQLCTQSN